MFDLKERQKARAYNHAVNAGEVKDPVIQHGTAVNGDVIGDDGKPVPGTAAKGFKPDEGGEGNGGEGGEGNQPVDYTKFTTHADLDAEFAKLNKDPAETGWGGEGSKTVAEKQAKLAELTKPATTGWN